MEGRSERGGLRVDASDIAKWSGIAFGAVGSALGIQKFLSSRRKALDERFAKLATTEQVERHKVANDAQVAQAREDIRNLYRLNEKQDDKLDALSKDVGNMHTELLQAILEGRKS